jgi:hypothetical protein
MNARSNFYYNVCTFTAVIIVSKRNDSAILLSNFFRIKKSYKLSHESYNIIRSLVVHRRPYDGRFIRLFQILKLPSFYTPQHFF